jgi:surface protein
MTTITNSNIRHFVGYYIQNQRALLPNNLRHLAIGDWNVSAVTDMSMLFANYNTFNEPLNNWTVHAVTNMSRMFIGCSSFNQPLDRWNVHNVRDMSRMFYGCTNFNQDLSGWNLRAGIVADNIFTNSGVTPENQPDLSMTMEEESDDSDDSDDNNAYDEYASSSSSSESDYDDDDESMGPPPPRPRIVLPPIQYMPIHNGAPRHLTQNTEIFSIFDGGHISARDLPPINEVTSILFYHNNNYILTDTTHLRSLIDMNNPDNALVLICRQVFVDALDIREPDLRDTTIYVNTQKLGLITGGYVRASYVLAALNHRDLNTTESIVYVLTPDMVTPPAETVVSLEYYVDPDADATSSSHCQPGRGGDESYQWLV